ncbi:sulfite exporter TauE/SafE family protein [Ancrocorticia populi]|uniref:sulfite exporter TauE/SafE family protein n=1 Tax=Ancrocorticia populi TaxID=2175228 RepID=UPI003F92606F
MWEYALLFVAGIGAGAVGYLMGLASLVSYPVLLLAGLPPVLANTTNTVGLLGSGAGSVLGARHIIREIKIYPLWPQLLVSLVGGILGGQLLLVMDPKFFEAVVPWMVLASTILVIVSPLIHHAESNAAMPLWGFLLGLLLVTTYAGYFGAGAGLPFFAMCVIGTPMTMHQAVAIKTPMILLANGSASVMFIIQGQVDWPIAITLAIGAFIGGYLGPVIQRVIPERIMRILVVLGGLILTVWLLLR